MRVAGVDGCAGGWVAVVTEAADPSAARVVVAPRVADILDAVAPDLLVVDSPIGLVDGPEPRDVDAAMRAMLKGKTSSVFNTPCREALTAETYWEASDTNRRRLRVGLSKQTFAIMPRIAEVDHLVRRVGQDRVREGHPEVSFAVLAGEPVLEPKRSLPGQERRRMLLETAGLPAARLLASVPRGYKGAADDVLDATALAWTALRALRGEHITLPSAPSRDAAGLLMSVIA